MCIFIHLQPLLSSPPIANYNIPGQRGRGCGDTSFIGWTTFAIVLLTPPCVLRPSNFTSWRTRWIVVNFLWHPASALFDPSRTKPSVNARPAIIKWYLLFVSSWTHLLNQREGEVFCFRVTSVGVHLWLLLLWLWTPSGQLFTWYQVKRLTSTIESSSAYHFICTDWIVKGFLLYIAVALLSEHISRP